jgi:geranylgeranyl diphosphate synthase type I
LIVSIIVDAKAHHVLVELLGKLDHDKYLEVHRVFKDFLVRMIEGEALNVEVKKRGFVNSQDLLRVFAKQSADIEACTQLGAIIGCGSKKDVELLATYGRSLGTLLLLNDDNRDAFNLTLELEDKIRSGSYPYPLMWAANHSTEFKQLLQSLHNKKRISPNDAKQCVTLLFESGTIAHVKDLMEKMAAEAVSTLEALNDTEAKRALEVIAESQPCRVLGQSLSFLP